MQSKPMYVRTPTRQISTDFNESVQKSYVMTIIIVTTLVEAPVQLVKGQMVVLEWGPEGVRAGEDLLEAILVAAVAWALRMCTPRTQTRWKTSSTRLTSSTGSARHTPAMSERLVFCKTFLLSLSEK